MSGPDNDSKLNADLVLRRAFDEASGRIKTDAEVSATIGSVDVVIDAATGDNIAISDGVNVLEVNPDGSINTEIDKTGLATDTLQTAGNNKLDDILTELELKANLTDTQPVGVVGTVPVSGPLTDVQLRATPVPVSGTVTANTGLSQPLTDTQLRNTPVPVSGTVSTGLSQPLTDAQLRAVAVPVSGPLTDAQLRAAPIDVNTDLDAIISGGRLQVELPAGGGGLTDAELRASPVDVDTGLTQPLTDAQLRAVAVPVSGSFYQATQPISAAALPLPAGAATEATLGDIKTAVQILDNAVSGSEMQVDIVAALPTGANVIGQVTANAGTNLNTSALNLEATQSAMSAKLPATLGQKTMANSMAVAVASDQSAVPVAITDVVATGSITAANASPTSNTPTANSTVATAELNGAAVAAIQITGTFTASLGVYAIVDDSGNNWVQIQASQIIGNTGFAGNSLSAGLQWMRVSGFKKIRVNCSSYTSGTAVVTIRTSTAADNIPVVTQRVDVSQVSNTFAVGTQSTQGFNVQQAKDAGRNQTNYFMASQVISTNTETLQTLTGYKSGAAVVATTTPAVVTAGKRYRIERIVITYVSIATAGSICVNLRANTGGVVALGSPVVDSWLVGTPAAVAGVTKELMINYPDGLEFAAGTGIGITVQGISAVGAGAATGYAKISVAGYEY